jgi:hypothetical protein
MEFDEISLVTRPANQLSKVVLFKSDVEENMPSEEGDLMVEDNAADAPVELPQEVFDYIKALEEANEELVSQVQKLSSPDDDDDFDDLPVEEDILKSADPRIVEIVKAAQERAEAAEMIAKAERDFRLEREYIAKAATLDHLPISADEFGKVLKSTAEAVDTEVFATLWRVLEAANASAASGGLFREVGKSSYVDNGPSTTIEKAAAAIRQSDPSLTKEQAIAKALENDPALYIEYLREVK